MNTEDRIRLIFNRFPYRPIIAILILMACFTFLFLLLYRSIPEGNRDAVNLSAGILLGAALTVVTYYFGSSKDKSDSDKASQANNIEQVPKQELSGPTVNDQTLG